MYKNNNMTKEDHPKAKECRCGRATFKDLKNKQNEKF